MLTGFAEASCTADSPYVGYRLVIPDDQLKRQSIVLSEKDCVDTCCLKKYCDAVWILEGSCYHARCKTNSQCIPVKAQWPHDDESNIVYVMRRTTPLDDEGKFKFILCLSYICALLYFIFKLKHNLRV